MTGAACSTSIFSQSRLSKPEWIRDGGTCVRIWLDTPLSEKGGLLYRYGSRSPYTLAELCKKICPSLDVNVTTQQENEFVTAVSSSDWINIDGVELLKRFNYIEYSVQDDEDESTEDVDEDDDDYEREELISRAASNLRLLKNENGKIVGRACIARYGILGVITVGGVNAGHLMGIAGVLTGASERAARDIAEPYVAIDVLSAWASEQSGLIPHLHKSAESQMYCAEVIRRCGGNTGELPIARLGGKWVSYRDIAQSIDLPDQLLFIESYELYELEKVEGFKFAANVIVVNHEGHTPIIQGGRYAIWPDYLLEAWDINDDFFERTLGGTVVEAIAEAWKVTVE